MSEKIETTPESVELKDTDIIAKNGVYPTMNKIFKQWEDRLVPVQVTRDERGKKQVDFEPWGKGQEYHDFNRDFDNKNSIAMRTGDGIGVIDVDTKDLSQLNGTWKVWVKDRLDKHDTLIVETFNGYHIYINLKDFKMKSVVKEGKDKTAVPFIDFRGEGGAIFIASLADQVSYEVLSDCELLEVSSELLELLPEKQEVEITKADDMDINSNDLYKKKTLDEVEIMLKLIPNNLDRTHWMEVVGSAYHAVAGENTQEVITLLKSWSKKDYDEFDERKFNYLINELEVGSYGANFDGSKLIREALNGKVKKIITKIEKSPTIEDMESFLTSKTWLSVPLVYENSAVSEIVEAYQNKERKLGYKATRRDTVINKINDSIIQLKRDEAMDVLGGLIIGFDGANYIVTDSVRNIKSKMMSKGNTVDYIMKATGVDRKIVAEVLQDLAINISDTMLKTDYLQDIKARFIVEKHPSDIIADPVLMIYTNPLFDVKKIDFDMEIINDFTEDIWDGKLLDLLRLIALTIVFKDKKNIIGIVAPPNTSKSAVPMMLGAPKTTIKPLISAMTGGKGMGKKTIDEMRNTGLLLIDEQDTAIPDELKGFVEGITLDQFGANGGSQNVDLKCTILTSTHATMFSHADNEIVERCLMLQVANHKHSIKQSPIYLKDPIKYREHTEAFLKWTFKQEFLREHKTVELLELQERYKVELQQEDVLEVVYEEVVSAFIDDCEHNRNGCIMTNDGICAVKTKDYILHAVETALSHYPELPNPKGKQSEITSKIIDPESKSKDRKKIKGGLYWISMVDTTDISIDNGEGFEDISDL